MIFLHIIIGLFLGSLFCHQAAFIVGSVLPDLDHFYAYLRSRKFRKNMSWKMFIDMLKNEDVHNVRSKTPLFHSLFGLIIFSLVVMILSTDNAIFFAVAYLLHLLLDWLDKDEKYFLFPFKIRFRGFLPIWSRAEQIATVIALVILGTIYVV